MEKYDTQHVQGKKLHPCRSTIGRFSFNHYYISEVITFKWRRLRKNRLIRRTARCNDVIAKKLSKMMKKLPCRWSTEPFLASTHVVYRVPVESQSSMRFSKYSWMCSHMSFQALPIQFPRSGNKDSHGTPDGGRQVRKAVLNFIFRNHQLSTIPISSGRQH